MRAIQNMSEFAVKINIELSIRLCVIVSDLKLIKKKKKWEVGNIENIATEISKL